MKYIERRTEGNKTVVVFKYGALYYYLMWPTIVVSVLAGVMPQPGFLVAAAVCWVLLISLAVPMWSTIREIKRVMKNGVLKGSGSKWSFSNPLRYEWESDSKPMAVHPNR
jgi:hypothetical protein